MDEQLAMCLLLALAWLGMILVIFWTRGLHGFSPLWVIAGQTGVIMIVVIYAATWFLRMCVALERLLGILTGQRPNRAHHSLRVTLRHLRSIIEELGGWR